MDTPGGTNAGHPADEFSAVADELTCRQFVELVTEYFEGVLDARTLNHVEEHLVMCDWCVTYTEQIQATVDALGQLTDPKPPAPPDTVLAALRARRDA